jgi:hypothetical protein
VSAALQMIADLKKTFAITVLASKQKSAPSRKIGKIFGAKHCPEQALIVPVGYRELLQGI